jgi:DHA1 family multidrug resistance protein-like MFS transporter
VLALRQFSQQGLDLAGGIVGDRFGARGSIAVGCFIRAAGFLGIGGAHTLLSLIGWAVASGIGGAFFDAPSSAALADLVEPDRRQRVFAASATMGNAGATLGPVLGVALLGVSFTLVSVVAAACFVLIGALVLALLPGATLAGSRRSWRALPGVDQRMHLGRTLRALCHDRVLVWMTALLAGFWFLWAQMNISVPLAAAQLGGPRLVALAFVANAGPAILLQYSLARYTGARYSARALLGTSCAMSGIGMALVFVSPFVTVFFCGIALFALGRLLIGPVINAVTADLAPEGMLGAYYGFAALSVGIGAGAGQYAGGLLYDLALVHHQPALLWVTLTAVGLGSGLGLWRLSLPKGHREAVMPRAGGVAMSKQ